MICYGLSIGCIVAVKNYICIGVDVFGFERILSKFLYKVRFRVCCLGTTVQIIFEAWSFNEEESNQTFASTATDETVVNARNKLLDGWEFGEAPVSSVDHLSNSTDASNAFIRQPRSVILTAIPGES